MSLKYCAIRSQPRKFGILFTVPDRVTAEINDKKRIMGKNPLRITRIPSGGPSEFHKLMQEAEKGSSPLTLKKKKNGIAKKLLNHKRAYHRSRFNDWYVEVFYFENCSGSQPSEPNSSGGGSSNSGSLVFIFGTYKKRQKKYKRSHGMENVTQASI